ncbi:MAG: LTA synthase family protein [Flavobacteriales bacterium]|nr:LTA synthase family protein [Flavobacteriales bacterium]
MNLIDVAYFDFSLKRTTTDFFSMIGIGGDFLNLLPLYIIDFWYNYILFVILLYLSYFLYKKYCKPNLQFHIYHIKDYLIHTLILILFSGLTLISMRGGLQYKPINIVNAGQYTKAQNTPIVLNTPFTILKTLNAKGIKPINYFSEKELATIYTPKTQIINNNALKGKNVVLIILESFAKEYVGAYHNGEGYTPFIDSLMKESYVFTNAYSNGNRSIEALPCILAGLPQLMNTPYVLSTYSSNKLDGLPETLKKEGYNTSFYHGGENGTMEFNGFSGSVGVDNYYGYDEYPNQKKDFDGFWGVFDEPYLQYYATELAKKPAPFFSTLFTVSSHHPYTIPKKHIDKFNKGNLPLHETIGYTDYSLKEFFKTAQKMPWFKHTIFVFTADHSSESNAAKYKTRVGMYSVPTFIYDPSGNLKGTHQKVFQHIDISPTILGLVGTNKEIISFGNNAFSPEEKFAIQYINGAYQIITKDHFLIFDGEKTTSFYYLPNDSLLQNNFVNQTLSYQRKVDLNRLEKKLKAIIQQYNNRLINNQLSSKKTINH